MSGKKKPYKPNYWAYMKPKEDNRRKLTLFVAGAVPPYLPERLDRLTSNYEVVTVMCGGNTGRYGVPEGKEKTEMEKALEAWAKSRRQTADAIPMENLNTIPGTLQFLGPDGNKAVIVYNDGYADGDDVRFANVLSREEGVQFRETKIEPKGKDFADAVATVPTEDNGLSR